jgi:hypothetical protein
MVRLNNTHALLATLIVTLLASRRSLYSNDYRAAKRVPEPLELIEIVG